MFRVLDRLLRPAKIALIGGSWTVNVAEQLTKSSFSGEVIAVNPKRDTLGQFDCVKSVEDLPFVPDAAFIGVNRELTVLMVAKLNKLGAGGAVCFASGFKESDLEGAEDLQSALVEAAADMPILGPNCYGLINYLDNVTLWPDQHGGTAVERGVAILGQSSNVAINMTMQRRGLPLAYLVALGNQAHTDVSDLIVHMARDPRVSAIGMHLEGIADLKRFCAAIAIAHECNKPVVVLKVGKSLKSQLAAQSHTASLCGAASAATALFKRLGIVEVDDIEVFLETLKLLHFYDYQVGDALCSVSCSGGEAGLMADAVSQTELRLPDFSESASRSLGSILGQKVSIANPLDYHTYIWGDIDTMTATFSEVMSDSFDLVVFVLDIPHRERCDAQGHDCADLNY